MKLESAEFLKRLVKPEKACEGPGINKSNKDHVRNFHDEVHTREDYFEKIEDPLGGKWDIVLATRDRYGLPINTVMNLDSGLIRSDPYYNDESIGILYRTYYRKIYECSFGMPAAPKSDLTKGQIERGLSIIEKTRGILTSQSRILDYGCGVGGTLLPFKEAGHEVLGLDYGEDYLNFGKSLGIPLLQGGIERLEGQAPFDLIILSHVLEHMKEPVQFLNSLKKWLSEDGIIYIEVPSLRWVGTIWNHDFLLHLQNAHIWYFTALTLKTLLSRAGLEVQEQYGSVAVLAKASNIGSISPSSKHATDCLKYLKLNEWIFNKRTAFGTLPKPVARKLLGGFKDL
jgi:2-polyprenyl-3-methyl-5-hydroxy-6-metoxy-1,4-benzoquinol methylase